MRKGVSRSCNFVIGSSRSGKSSHVRTLTSSGRVRERQLREERFSLNTSGLGKESREILSDLRDESYFADESQPNAHFDGPTENEEQSATADVSEGEFMEAVQDVLAKPWYRYKDGRTWGQRRARFQANWTPLLKDLVSAYLEWKYPRSPSRPDNSTPSIYDFTIPVLDVFAMEEMATIKRSDDCASAAVALVHHGYMPCSPLSPSLAISLRSLELYHRIRLRKPSFSIEAFAKVFCDVYHRPYSRRYRHLLANAFDAYLTVVREVDRQVQEVLGRASANWRVLNACPPCSYEIEGEPELWYRRMVAIDGNNSLSRMALQGDRQVGDQRCFTSDYFLEPEYVNTFATSASTSADEVAAQPDPQVDGAVSGCTDNWKAAAEDMSKKAWGVFDETGIFACACRHGLMLWVVDMIRSGELFKYPLSIVGRALDVLGPRLLIGYDIGCKLATTIRSSPLATKFEDSKSRMCVDSFHGYTHNYACQDRNHPNVIEGVGLEDLSTMERIFSASNQLTSVTRYATTYNRRLFIDMYFRQWDEDKYVNLGKMLYDNYRQALRIVNDSGLALQQAKTSLQIDNKDLQAFRVEQSKYLETLGQESEWDVHAVTYVELLQKVREARARKEDTMKSFLNMPVVPENYVFVIPESSSALHHDAYSTNLSQTRKLETARRQATERLNILLADVAAMELKMGITRTWEPTDEPYVQTIKYICQQQYHRALNDLQRLVVLRLMELHKMNLGQAGYRMRTQIAKSLQTRCKAIQNAIKTYNTAAAALEPPAPALEWSRVSHYGFLQEFTLLKETRDDVRMRPWVQPAIREAMRLGLRVDRAKEEIIRCNIEVRRLHSAIKVENEALSSVCTRLQTERHPLHGEVEAFVQRRMQINSHLLSYVHRIFDLDGFTGDRTIGQRVGVERVDVSRLPRVDSQTPHGENEEDEWFDVEDDADGETIGRIADFISDLPSNRTL